MSFASFVLIELAVPSGIIVSSMTISHLVLGPDGSILTTLMIAPVEERLVTP